MANPQQSVRKRLVLYIPGFDPMPPNRYREGYKSEGEKQAEISDYHIDVERMPSLEGVPRFHAKSIINDHTTHTEFRFLTWNDLVRKNMDIPIWKSWALMINIGRVIAGSGALRRLMKLHFPANLTGLYPFLIIPLQILIAFFIGRLCGALVSNFAPDILGWIVNFAVMVGLIWLFRKWDHHILPYYVVHDLSYFIENDGYTPPSLRARIDKLKKQIKIAIDEKSFDEILIVGHSSGAHIGVMMVAELLRDNELQRKDNVSLLTLGQAIPLVSYLPKAHDLRLCLYELGKQDIVSWVDVSAPSDGVCFALCDPVACSVDVDYAQKYPRMISAAFSNTLSEAYQKRIKYRFFRIHFQYLCHFDKPRHYDYFQITSGPIRLWERYGTQKDSPSTKRKNLNGFKDMAP